MSPTGGCTRWRPTGPPPESRLTLATVVLVAALIGGTFSALEFGLDHTTPFLLASMRTVLSGSFLVGLALLVEGTADAIGGALVVVGVHVLATANVRDAATPVR